MEANKNNAPETIPMTWHKKYQDRGHGCPLCGKAFKTLEKKRFIHVGAGGDSILRADLPCTGGFSGECAVFSDGTVDTGDMGWFEIGDACAKKLGKEWSKELPPIEPNIVWP